MEYTSAMLADSLDYLALLSTQYPSIQSASSQIINLSAICCLPKGTEHFMSDLHGEYASFMHILRNASGVIKVKINDLFRNTLSHKERSVLATLIYYPEEKLELVKASEPHLEEWYRLTLYRLVEVCRSVTSKYSRDRVRQELPKDFEHVIDELLNLNTYNENQQDYYNAIFQAILDTHRADAFIIAISRLIQRLAIEHLHILGDIYDRGPGADIIMDALMRHPRLDIQWGNHDILWMGAAAGSGVCIANVIVNSIKYNNFDTIEEGYGISLRPLSTFAAAAYADDPCEVFLPRSLGSRPYHPEDESAIARMHKAIAVILFKLEGQAVARNPAFFMEDRRLLDKIDLESGRLLLNGQWYPMTDTRFPTLDPADPYTLSPEESEVMARLTQAFLHSEKLQAHVRFLYDHGSMYLTYNGNLLFHGCIPLDQEGRPAVVSVTGQALSGRAYLDACEALARQGFFASPGSAQRQAGEDFLWYLWCGPKSPLYGKSRMTTFERYFILDERTHEEKKDPYYAFNDQIEICRQLLASFGLNPDKGHIVNGHVPVRIKKGESPVKAGGRLLVIDGGLSKAYQAQTGIAGYTLIYNSHGLFLASHEPFENTAQAIADERDIHSLLTLVEPVETRLMIRDTDTGRELARQIKQLHKLIAAYRLGLVKQRQVSTVDIPRVPGHSWMDRT